MTPEEFVEESRQANASWENDVTCKGKALSVLREVSDNQRDSGDAAVLYMGGVTRLVLTVQGCLWN